MVAARDRRHALLAKVHIAKKALSLDDDVYRMLLESSFERSSARDLTIPELEELVGLFQKRGWEPKPTKKAQEVNQGKTPQQRMVLGLWHDLKKAGKPRDPSERGLRRFVKRVAGVDAVSWLTPEQASKVIEGLKAWLARPNRETRSTDSKPGGTVRGPSSARRPTNRQRTGGKGRRHAEDRRTEYVGRAPDGEE